MSKKKTQKTVDIPVMEHPKQETRKETLRRLFEHYNLVREDVFTHKTQGWTIIKRTGVDKIQAKSNIEVQYTVESLSTDHTHCLLKAVGKMGDKFIQTFGECSPKNNSGSYSVCIAEARAMSRAVLKLAGFYALGLYAEEESEDFKDPR